MWLPLEITTAVHRRRIELTEVLISACGILFHSWMSAWRSSFMLAGRLGQHLNRLNRLSQICSMGLRSGLLAGQSSLKSMLFVLRKCIVFLAVWEVALSCWKIEMLALLWNRGMMWCDVTIEHLNYHQWRLVVNDDHVQWLPRPWQNPQPRTATQQSDDYEQFVQWFSYYEA